MTLYNFVNGSVADADQVNANTNYILNNQVATFIGSDVDTTHVENFHRNRFHENAEDINIDVTNTTCCYVDLSTSASTSGGAWFCTQLDQFDAGGSPWHNGSWTYTSNDGGAGTIRWITGGSNTGGADYCQIGASGNWNNPKTSWSRLSTSGGLLDMKGQNGEVILHVYSISECGDQNGVSASNILYVGSTAVYTITTASRNQSDNGYFAINLVFDASGQTVAVYENGTQLTTGSDISGESEWNINIRALSTTDSNGYSRAWTNFYTTGYIKDGDSNTPQLIGGSIVGTAATNSMFLRYNTLSENGVFAGSSFVSCDNGATYIKTNNKELINTPQLGSEHKVKFTQTVPVPIETGSINIPRLKWYGYFYG